MAWSRLEIAARGAADLRPGQYVNLGIGLPTIVANLVPVDSRIWFHSENGILGVGPAPASDAVDPDLINAGKETVTVLPGSSFFDSALSFAMVRGGRIDVAVLGGMQVSSSGDLANWMVPGQAIKGPGGAMDLVHGAKQVVVLMTHTTKTGEPKLVTDCSFPLTGQGVVSRVITDLAVLDVTGNGFEVVELAPGVSFEELAGATGAPVLDAR